MKVKKRLVILSYVYTAEELDSTIAYLAYIYNDDSLEF